MEKNCTLIRHIWEMVPGETGYATPWSYDPVDEYLDIERRVHPVSRGTANMHVTCTEPGYYEVRLVRTACPPKKTRWWTARL